MTIDHNKLDPAMCFMAGIFNRPWPQSDFPKSDDELVVVDEDDLSEATLRKALENGGMQAAMYYGGWRICRLENGLFRGELRQYRNITDTFTDSSIDDALEKAKEWGAVCRG